MSFTKHNLPIGYVEDREIEPIWVCAVCGNVTREWPRDGRCPAMDASAERCNGLVRVMTDRDRNPEPQL